MKTEQGLPHLQVRQPLIILREEWRMYRFVWLLLSRCTDPDS